MIYMYRLPNEMTDKNINEIIDLVSESVNSPNSFFVPSLFKLMVMSLITCGWYVCYWLYKNWWVIKRSGKNCNPLLRTILSPLSAYSYFWCLRERMIKHKIDRCFPIVILTIIMVCESLFPIPILYAKSTLEAGPFIDLLCNAMICIPTIWANNIMFAINEEENPYFIANSKFSKGDWIVIVLSIFLRLLTI